MRTCLRPRFALLAILLAAGLSAEAQVMENKRPMVFIWAEDSQTARRLPLGSGFVLNAQGDVLTAKHIVEKVVEGQHLVVSITTKSAYSVRVDMTDQECAPTQDFCLIRVPQDVIDGLGLPEFYRLGCYVPREGEPLMAAGFVGGANPHAGLVTPTGAVIGTMMPGRLLPTSIPLEPTMSGGPVFDSTMTVIGLVKGGTTGGQFGFVQLLQPARSMLGDRGMDCLGEPPKPVDEHQSPLSGTWRDHFGGSFQFNEADARVTLNGRAGDRVMEGSGKFFDSTLVVQITNNLEPGTIYCEGKLTHERVILATCTGPDDNSFGWDLTRVSD